MISQLAAIQFNELLTPILIMICGFLLGAVMFSRIVPLLFLKKDICSLSDDKNPGSGNVFSFCGVKWGLLCLALDMAKGFLPVFLAYKLLGVDNPFFAVVMVMPLLGHALAPFSKCRGGKCIAPFFGELSALLPVTHVGLILCAFYIFFSLVIKINPNRLRSIVSNSLFAVIGGIVLVYNELYVVAIGTVLSACLVILKHTKRFSYVKPNETVK